MKDRKKELLKLRKGLCIALNSTLLILLSGCKSDSRIDNIEDYYLLRTAGESGTKANIIYIKDKIKDKTKVRNTSDDIVDGYIRSYNDTYYEGGIYNSAWENFSPIQFIPYHDVMKKDTYYDYNMENDDSNLEAISNVLEDYAFPTNAIYTFGENSYEYTCHVYEIEDKVTNTKSYVIGYPVIPEETNPTQIYNALNASFIYIKTNEFATQVPSKLDEMDAFTLEEGHALLDEIIKENQGVTRILTPEE